MAQDRIKHEPGPDGPATDGDSPYQTDYFGPERYEDYDSGEQVINHLMFYKSIISEEDSGQKISEYMELVRGLKEGEHLPIKDPFDKSIALTFELVMQNHMNPWDVDLLKFSNLYMERMKAEQEVDFITAGRLMFMAWSVLKLQSDEVLANSQPAPTGPVVDSGWDPGAAADWMQSDASVDFTTAVLNRPEPPLQESVYRHGTRPVTLFELVGAFEEARKEAELQKVLAEERRKQRLVWESQKALRVDKMMHREDLQEDINHVWGLIQPLSGKIPLARLCNGGCDDDRLTAFVSILFLAFVKQIRVWQEDFPYGEIFIEKAGEGDLPLEKLQNITHPQRKEIWDVKKKKGKLFQKKKGKKGDKAEKAERGEGGRGRKAEGAAEPEPETKAPPLPAPNPAPAEKPVKPGHEHHKAPSPSPYAAPGAPAPSDTAVPSPASDSPLVPR
jgi:segregation and condensation protein A